MSVERFRGDIFRNIQTGALIIHPRVYVGRQVLGFFEINKRGHFYHIPGAKIIYHPGNPLLVE